MGGPTFRGMAAAAALLSFGVVARADDSHYQDFLVGGRSVGLGGAYTSIASDPSGVYYNPAGLADVTKTSVQVSTSLYGFEHGSIDQSLLPVPGLENLDVEFTELIVIPASAGFVKTLGQRGDDGLPTQAYAVNVMVPSFRSFNAGSPSSEPDGVILVDRGSSYSRRVTDRSLWAGLGYGAKIGQRLRVGVSGFYILRSAVDIEDVSLSASIDDGDGDPANDQQVFRTARNDITYINGNIALIVGAKYLLTDELSVGVSFQTPSLHVHSQSALRFSTGDSVPACELLGLSASKLLQCQQENLLQNPRSGFVNEELEGGSETRYAPTLRVGASYSKPYRWTISGDLTYHFPVDYTLISSPALNDALLARMPFSPHVKRQGVLNANIGAEYLIIREVSISAGFYTDSSSSARIPQDPAGDQQPRVQMLGMTMALGYFSEHTLSRLGVLYTFGEGKDVIPASDVDRILERTQAFQRVDYFQSFFYVYVSSTFRY